MNELKIFEHPRFGKIRTIVEDGKTLFCGKDAALALSYKDTDDAIRRHCRYPSKHRVPHPQNPDKTIVMTFITDGDLCRLAAKSEMLGADEFESWIFDEVVPSVLRNGGYVFGQESMTPEELMASALTEILEKNAEKYGEIILDELNKKEVPTMKVSYNGFTGELVKLERKEAVMTFNPFECCGAVKTGVYDLSIYDGEKKAAISFTGVKMEDLQFHGGAVTFGG